MISSHSLAVIIRASGENTLKESIKIVKKQLLPQDSLDVLEENVSFEKKLQFGFQKAIKLNKDFTVFIDADILLRKNALSKVRENIVRLSHDDFGFGFLLFDRFYKEPKFRGFHVYKTSIITEAIKFIPEEGKELRPETYVKNQLIKKGFNWQNHLTHYIAGIHDFYQKPSDVYFKFLVRSQRSKKDLKKLRIILSKSNSYDFKIALKALNEAKNFEMISNNKYLYNPIFEGEQNIKRNKFISVDFMVYYLLFKKYNLQKLFWKSIR